MSRLFVPLDVDYASDGEFIECGPYAELLFIRALCFVKRKRLDGVLMRSQLRFVASGIPKAGVQADRLVEVGLWEDRGDHWFIPSYLKRNKSSAEISAVQDIQREKGALGAHRRWHLGDDGTPDPKCEWCVKERLAKPSKRMG